MSMFNTIIINCPNCDNEVEFQTKSGSRLTLQYHIKSVPKEEIKGILGDSKKCNKCGREIKIKDANKVKKDFSHLIY